MGIKLSDIKKEISKAGTNRGKILFLKDGSKVRVRFLTDFEDGIAVPFHDSYEQNVTVPCQEVFGRECPYCEDDSMRTRTQYVWCVYDYEAKEVKLLMHPVSRCSPVGTLASLYESYGTLLDRDYEIKRTGNGTNTMYSVISMDKEKFRNTKVKAMSEQAILKTIDKAYPCDDTDEEEDDDEESTDKKSKKIMNEPEDDDWNDYDEMKPQELYKLCMDRGIECKKKMSKQYYIDLLENDDSEDWEE